MTDQAPQWYAWGIKGGKYQLILDYINQYIPEVVDVERPGGADGKTSYIFMKYANPDKVIPKIVRFRLIGKFIGKCNDTEIVRFNDRNKDTSEK